MLAASETSRKIFDLVRKKIVQVQDKNRTKPGHIGHPKKGTKEEQKSRYLCRYLIAQYVAQYTQMIHKKHMIHKNRTRAACYRNSMLLKHENSPPKTETMKNRKRWNACRTRKGECSANK